MEYKEKIMLLLRQEIEPRWNQMQELRKSIGAPSITIEEQLETLFEHRVNCGGYALEVDACIFPAYSGSFEQTISGILDNFEFVRLLGDSELQQDEYIVVYRSDCKGSHHFIKIKEGKILEKNESQNIKSFSSWPTSLKAVDEAVFAVKNEHSIVLTDENGCQKHSVMLDDVLGDDFEQTIEKCILNGQVEFDYHGHSYCMKGNPSDSKRAFVISQDRVIGEIMIDGNECVVEIAEVENNYVSNTKSNNRQYLETIKSIEDVQR